MIWLEDGFKARILSCDGDDLRKLSHFTHILIISWSICVSHLLIFVRLFLSYISFSQLDDVVLTCMDIESLTQFGWNLADLDKTLFYS